MQWTDEASWWTHQAPTMRIKGDIYWGSNEKNYLKLMVTHQPVTGTRLGKMVFFFVEPIWLSCGVLQSTNRADTTKKSVRDYDM